MKILKLCAIGIISSFLICAGLFSCNSAPPPPAPKRDFATEELLINQSVLPVKLPHWQGPDNYGKDRFGLFLVLEVSAVDFGNADDYWVTQLIGRFGNIRDAENSFNEHDYSRSNEGKYGSTYKPVSGFNYKSPLANQFNVACGYPNHPELVSGVDCTIEARYEEFLSIIVYRANKTDPAHILENLEMLAKATDEQIGKYIK
jgi:hypothetical protein